MSDYQTFIADRISEVDNRNSRTEPYIRAATIRALKEVSSVRCLLREASFSFTTTASQAAYTAGYPSFAVDISQILLAYYPTANGSARRMIERTPLEEVRRSGLWQTIANPQRYCWHSDSLILGPIPSGEILISVDYQRDALRDSATGNLITTSSTTATNQWFDRGEHVLRALVLRDYHMSISGDQASASSLSQLAAEGMATLKNDFQSLGTSSAQAPGYFEERGDDYLRVVF